MYQRAHFGLEKRFGDGCVLLCLYRLVCYLVKRKWLTEATEIANVSRGIRIKDEPQKKADEGPSIVDDKPGCSHWEEGELSLVILIQF